MLAQAVPLTARGTWFAGGAPEDAGTPTAGAAAGKHAVAGVDAVTAGLQRAKLHDGAPYKALSE